MVGVQNNISDLWLDDIFECVDHLMLEGAFWRVNNLLRLRLSKVESIPTDVLIGWLTATLPAKSKLSMRLAFFKAVQLELVRRGEKLSNVMRILKGLE